MRPHYPSQQDPTGNKKMINGMLVSALNNSFYVAMKCKAQLKNKLSSIKCRQF